MSELSNHRREVVLPGLWHDYANLFPMLDAAGQDALRADIKAHGVREAVILHAGRILDGRNRYMAARDLGLDFPVADFAGTDAEALAYVLSTNLHRRHLTESQRSAVAAKLANMKHGGDRKSDQAANLRDDNSPQISTADAAKMLNVGTRSVEAARKVQHDGSPELNAAVESGAVAVSAAATVADLPKEEQSAVVAEGPKAVKARAKEIRKAKAAPAADTEADPEVAKVKRELAKMTAEGVAGLVVELRAALAEAKADKVRAKAEAAKFKDLLKQFDGDRDQTIKSLSKTIEHKNSEMFRANEKVQAELRKNFALKKRLDELEKMGVVTL